ncbi:hypothetical protein [Enterococcus sp. AD013-P3]
MTKSPSHTNEYFWLAVRGASSLARAELISAICGERAIQHWLARGSGVNA